MATFFRKITLTVATLLLCTSLFAQFYTAGNDPSKVKWNYILTDKYKIIYPVGTDSIAQQYALSLEKFAAVLGNSCGYTPNEKYYDPHPVVLHSYLSYSNGSVSSAPRVMDLYTTPDAYSPVSTPWIDQLAVHEGRHVAQMQFVRGRGLFIFAECFLGELWSGAASAIWPGPAFFEGDAVVAETALTQGGRGRNASFLEYYRASFGAGEYRDFWQWRYGSQKRYTPDYYRAGYMLMAGMRTTFNEPRFTNYYYERLFTYGKSSIYNLQKSIKEVSGLKFKEAFRAIEEDFASEWEANDSLRLAVVLGGVKDEIKVFEGTPVAVGGSLDVDFMDGERLTAEPKMYEQFSSVRPAKNGLYAIRSGLSRPEELVFVGFDGKVKRLSAFASMHSRLAGDADSGLYWTEYKPHPRWELASSSVLKSRGSSARSGKAGVSGDSIHSGKAGGKARKRGLYYNPAIISGNLSNTPQNSDTENEYGAGDNENQILLTKYLSTGETGVAVVEQKSGNEVRFYRAPDGVQVVETAFAGGQIYASGLSSEGIGIYSVPDWKCILSPTQVSVKGLFSKDDALWFTSDLSGVDELYTLYPTSGQLLQRSLTRFGADDFCFAPNGRLYFTAQGVNDRGIYSISADSLLAHPVDFTPLPRPRADALSAQELALMAENDASSQNTPGEAGGTAPSQALAGASASPKTAPATSGTAPFISAPKKYSKLGHLFKFHSWAPIYVEYDITSTLAYEETTHSVLPGASAWFQNDLGTSYGQIGISSLSFITNEDKVIRHHAAHLQWVYSGFFPVLEIKADYNTRNSVFNSFGKSYSESKLTLTPTTTDLERHYYEVSFRAYLPLSFSSGGWLRGIIPSVNLILNNDSYTKVERSESYYDPVELWRTRGELFTQWGLRAYSMLPTPSSCIFPRWGVGAEVNRTSYFKLSDTYGTLYSGQLYAYVPGILRTHGLRLAGSASMRYGSIFGNSLQWNASAEYAMPFLSVDWSGLSPVFYVRNFELRAFASVGGNSILPSPLDPSLCQVGGALTVELGNFLWVPYDTHIGVKYIHCANPDLSGFFPTFTMDF